MSLPAALAAEFRAITGPSGFLCEPEELRTYECDALTNMRALPLAVLLPASTEEVQAIVRVCHRERLPFVARGAGTGLSGGALPVDHGIVISVARMHRILEVDFANARVVVEPGVINLNVTGQVSHRDFFYAPDPSSQSVCSIGGNVAENSGGAHCLKYGFTTTHVLGLDVVLPDGRLVQLGGKALDAPGYDLVGVFVGLEGTLGIATKVVLRIVKRPECVQTLLAAFPSVADASAAVSQIIADGILASAMEIMDELSIQAAEAAVHAGYPSCAGLLLVELDGPTAEVEQESAAVRHICETHGASEFRLAKSDLERGLFWKGRKAAFAAMGRVAPNYIVQDGVIPRTALPEMMRDIGRLSEAAGLRVANVFHAGDGNLHPMVLYDRHVPGQQHDAEQLSMRILELCVEKGGSITGEHGVGEEKKMMMGRMFAEPDLDTMQRVRCAFDPLSLSNPTKVFPRPRLCGDRPGEYVAHPLETAGESGQILSDAMRAIVGAEHVRPASPQDAIRGVVPRLVAEPADGPQLAAVLAAATAQGASVVPRGGATKLEWGNRPRSADIVVSTVRLDRILEHAWSDLTVTVEAGCTIQTLQEVLRTRGQRVAVDPLWPERATVGGVLSTNDTGALRLRFGGLRDLIIGSTLALPDGTLASSGGKVVKNVAGYDVSKLATGALGTLGVITTAIFRLHPLPQQSRTLSAAAGSLDAMQLAIDALQDSKLAHSALQVRASDSAAPILDILFEGSAAGIEAQVVQAQTLIGSLALEMTPPATWQARQALWTGSGSVLKISALPADLAKTLQHIRRLAGTIHVDWAAVFQATGIGWLRIGETGERWSDLLRQLRQSVDGSVTVLRPPAPDDPADSWPDPGGAQALMSAVKQQFDPTGTLNPGRFVGRL